jgi:regulator of protease activity HflC (stomatin/prohibitin superfamily)
MVDIKNMLFRKQIIVGENQIALMFRNGQFSQVLPAGKHTVWDRKNEVVCEGYSAQSLYFTHPEADLLIEKHADLAAIVHNWRIADDEVGLLYVDDQLKGVVAPNEKLLLFKAGGNLRLERVSLNETLALPRKLLLEMKHRGVNTALKLIAGPGSVKRVPVLDVQVAAQHLGMLFVDGELVRTLSPGQYGFWQLSNKVEVKQFDLRSQIQEVSGQEIMTKDRVSVRVNLTATIKLVDAVLAAERVEKVDEFIYKSMQLALREAVGTKTLDALLEDKLYVNQTVKELVEEELSSIGVKLERVGVKDIILPGEIKFILNQVVEAQKAAEANVIKRREETAATRSLHNTAKMMENNPTLLRLKELEALENVSEKVGHLNVYGGIDQLMRETVKLS